MGRIVIFGATGYTGELTAQALVDRGARPVLAGRNPSKLQALATRLGGLDVAVADVHHPQQVQRLVGRGDVLLSLVGPFVRWGRPAVEAAVTRGAHYLDSTGEPPFIRRVFDDYGSRAQTANCALLPAMGSDWVPGNLAGALAVQDVVRAGDCPHRVSIGYFIEGPKMDGAFSGGTLASTAGAVLEPGFAMRDGRIRADHPGVRYREFDVGGRTRGGISVGGTEHFGIPQAHGQVREVEVYLGWFGTSGKRLSRASKLSRPLFAVPPMRAAARFAARRLTKGSTGGPGREKRTKQRSVVVAEVHDRSGRRVGRAVLRGRNPYDFTAGMLAWGAVRASEGGLQDVGALGPVKAFGLAGLERGVEDAGLQRIE